MIFQKFFHTRNTTESVTRESERIERSVGWMDSYYKSRAYTFPDVFVGRGVSPAKWTTRQKSGKKYDIKNNTHPLFRGRPYIRKTL